MATWQQVSPAIFPALGDQGYRPVAPAAFPDPTVQSFPATGNQEIDSALVGALQAPNWGELARQLRQFTLDPTYRGMAIRRDPHDLEVVIVQSRGEGAIQPTFLKEQHEHAWTITSLLSRSIDKFKLGEKTGQDLQAVLDKYVALQPGAKPGAPADASATAKLDPATNTGWDVDIEEIRKAGGGATPAAGLQTELWIKIALASLNLIKDLAAVSTATSILLFAGEDGLDDELTAQLERTGMLKKSNFSLSLNPPSLSAVGIDVPKLEVHGHAMAIGSLNLGRLGGSLRAYVR
jgi:hypothetical protein